MSKDAKKKAARNENFKDGEILRLMAENERHVKLWHDTQLTVIERATEIDQLHLALAKSADEVVRLNSELTASQDCATKYLAELDAIKSVLAAAEVVGTVTSVVEKLHQIQEPSDIRDTLNAETIEAASV